jgi:hypothetical protein
VGPREMRLPCNIDEVCTTSLPRKRKRRRWDPTSSANTVKGKPASDVFNDKWTGTETKWVGEMREKVTQELA